jgi:hypothetical protein
MRRVSEIDILFRVEVNGAGLEKIGKVLALDFAI